MGKTTTMSRRQFVASAVSAAAVSSLAAPKALSEMVSGIFPSLPAAGPEVAQLQAPDWKNQAIENLTRSPYAKLRHVPVRAVTIKSGFWAQRRETNVSQSIPSMHDLLEAHGRMNNFRRLLGKSDASQIGPVFSDSDVYKWTEAVGFVLQSGAQPALRTLAEKAIDEVVAVQEPSGYLNTYFVGDRAALRMLPDTQATGHELYNLGHMLQGAIAYYRATGERKLLDAGIRFVDGFLLPNYGPAPKKPIVAGHPEIEMALIELYRITGDKRQLELAGYILRGDDRLQFPERRTIYMFSGTPFTARTKLEGHAVRAMYACCGATDYYLETGDPTYWKTLNTLWGDLVSAKMYISGGVGARSDGEAFGDAYELPNYRAYGESCAAIGNMMWNWRMLSATGDAKFTDVMERALYNGINSGMSLNGTLYCYRNPLAFDPSTGDKIRNPWYDVTCCPPNLERTFASLPGYFYSTSSDGVYVHFYDNSELDWHLEDGTGLKVAQKTNYPWEGDIEIAVSPARSSPFTLYLRIPGWADAAQVAVNGKALAGVTPGEYLPIRRHWAAGDMVRLHLPMSSHVLQANPRVAEDTGRVAVQRGPILYCLEGLDQPAGVDLADVALNLESMPQSAFENEYKNNLLDGVVVLQHGGLAYERAHSQNVLYSRYAGKPASTRPVPLTFIPYYAWANREATAMQVWTRLFSA
ncbi:MAG TPA: beta-L-arabinofuranosidase domain-containing protein [Terriglobales bacterium]|nr:beta-L-arabinofuranosidase domain-containing protein [Terriglobales bacterium]